MDDLISRQAAVDAMKNMYQAAEKWGREASDDVIKARSESCMATLVEMKLRIEKLPSAQPEIIRCKDCNNWDTTWQNDWAKNYHYCPVIDGVRNGDWYCADAERRTDGSD